MLYKIGLELGQEFKGLSQSFIFRCLNLSRRVVAYYKENPPTDKYHEVKIKIVEIDKEKKNKFGKRRMCQELRNREGIYLNVHLISKLMKEAGVHVKQRKASKYSSYAGEISELAPNVLDRNFKADRPYEKIVTDISQFNVGEEKIYLSTFIDLYSNRIISYTLSKSPSVQSVTIGLKSVIAQIPEGMKTIIHSDQGMHYQHINYREIINNNENIIQSMSRKGNCLDNGACESFFGRTKEEMFFGEHFESIEELVEKLEDFLEYYNNNRLQIRLDGLTPVQHTLRYYKNCMQEKLTG